MPLLQLFELHGSNNLSLIRATKNCFNSRTLRVRHFVRFVILPLQSLLPFGFSGKDLIDSGLFSCSESLCLILNQSRPNLFLHRTLYYRSDACLISPSFINDLGLLSHLFSFSIYDFNIGCFLFSLPKNLFFIFGVCRSRTCSEILSATSLANCSITVLATHLIFPSLKMSNNSVFNLDLLSLFSNLYVFNIG